MAQLLYNGLNGRRSSTAEELEAVDSKRPGEAKVCGKIETFEHEGEKFALCCTRNPNHSGKHIAGAVVYRVMGEWD